MGRRMFSDKIVDTDAFLDMPQSSQLLYFHLGMRADDDGFVANPKKIMRMVGSLDDDFKVLIAKKFIIPFESGVCVIKHWLIHNNIRKDRYHETQWIKEKKQLLIDNRTNKYSLNKGQKLIGCQNDNQMATEVRLGKVRLGKVNKDIVAKKPQATTKTKKENKPFSLEEEIKKMEDNSRRDLNIIAFYFKKKETDIQNRQQLQVAIRRHLKSAGQLKCFTDSQLSKASIKAQKEYPDIWTLETLIKILTK